MNVKELREIEGLSQAKFAQKYQIPLSTLENWESEGKNKRTCSPYVLELLERCVLDDAVMQPVENNMTIQEIRNKTSLTRRDFAEKYHMSPAAITLWESGKRHCPDYVVKMLQRCVIYDERTRHYIHRNGDDITSSKSNNILGVFDNKSDASKAMAMLKQSIMAGDYDEIWGLKPNDRKKACSSLTTDYFQEHEFHM